MLIHSACCVQHVNTQRMLCVFVSAPAIFPIAYNLAKPFLSEDTKTKIRILGSKFISHAVLTQLLTNILIYERSLKNITLIHFELKKVMFFIFFPDVTFVDQSKHDIL